MKKRAWNTIAHRVPEVVLVPKAQLNANIHQLNTNAVDQARLAEQMVHLAATLGPNRQDMRDAMLAAATALIKNEQECRSLKREMIGWLGYDAAGRQGGASHG